MKILYFYLNRFRPKNMFKTAVIYGLGAFILLLWGVKGLVTTFLLIFCFFLGWVIHSGVSAIKDYRLTLRLNRVHYSQADYDTLRRENKALLDALQAQMEARGGGGGAVRGYRPGPAPAPSNTKWDSQRIEELKMRYEAEEAVEFDRDTNRTSRNG